MKKILLVEDDELTRKIISEILTSEGLTVIAVKNGEAAKKMLLYGDHFDLLITDKNYPGEVNGMKLVEIARQLDIPAILMTGEGYLPKLIQEAQQAGAQKVFLKPFSLKGMVNAVKSLLKKEL